MEDQRSTIRLVPVFGYHRDCFCSISPLRSLKYYHTNKIVSGFILRTQLCSYYSVESPLDVGLKSRRNLVLLRSRA